MQVRPGWGEDGTEEGRAALGEVRAFADTCNVKHSRSESVVSKWIRQEVRPSPRVESFFCLV